MKIVSEKYICDVCKEEIDGNLKKEISPDSIAKPTYYNISPDSLIYKFGGAELILEHICSTCSKKIYEFITEQKK